MKIKVKRVVVATFDETECAIILDGLQTIANNVTGVEPVAQRRRAKTMHDRLRNAWRTQ